MKTGAELLVREFASNGVTVWFVNPGTTELHLASAISAAKNARSILCLFEGVATGAADGYARMTGNPAACLLHLGVGLSYGWPNLHNARRAYSPVVVVIGDHPLFHQRHDPPLSSDIELLAHACSLDVRRVQGTGHLATDARTALSAANGPPGGVSVLTVPADIAWAYSPEENAHQTAAGPPAVREVPAERLDKLARRIATAPCPAFILGGTAPSSRTTQLMAARLAKQRGGCALLQTANARVDRGAGYPNLDRIPHDPQHARELLRSFSDIFLVEAQTPVAFFAQPNSPSLLAAAGAAVHTVTLPGENTAEALRKLADCLNATASTVEVEECTTHRGDVPGGPLTPNSLAAAVAANLPEEAIIVDESISAGRTFPTIIRNVPPHSWLQLTGGALGFGIPAAVGAAVACPDRKVIVFQADGSALYTIQGLWTLARENLDVLVVMLVNHAYALLQYQARSFGLTHDPEHLHVLTTIDNPSINWVTTARGLGVEAACTTTSAEFVRVLESTLHQHGPFLIEAVLAS